MSTRFLHGHSLPRSCANVAFVVTLRGSLGCRKHQLTSIRLWLSSNLIGRSSGLRYTCRRDGHLKSAANAFNTARPSGQDRTKRVHVHGPSDSSPPETLMAIPGDHACKALIAGGSQPGTSLSRCGKPVSERIPNQSPTDVPERRTIGHSNAPSYTALLRSKRPESTRRILEWIK